MPVCAKCGATYAGGQRFCGNCGTPLDADPDLARLIDERLDARLKDQRLIELETAQAVVARIGEWTKLFGFFVAFPVGILVIVLTILGFRQYSDFVRTVEASRNDLSRQLDAIKAEFAAAAVAGKTARTEGDKLNQEIAEIRKSVDLARATRLQNEIEKLSARVTGIESRFKIKGTAVSSALERSLTASLGRFADYMESVGFDAKQAPATVTIESKTPLSGTPNTYYSLDAGTVVVDAAIGNLEADPSMVLWPYAQHLMLLANKTAFTSFERVAQALSNGVPDYFVASYLNDPRIGRGYPGAPRGYLRNADNELKFGPAVTAPHDVGEIWAGAFWKIRQAAGQNATDRLIYTFWKSLRQADLADQSGGGAARQLLAAARAVDGGKHTATIRGILQARNLAF